MFSSNAAGDSEDSSFVDTDLVDACALLNEETWLVSPRRSLYMAAVSFGSEAVRDSDNDSPEISERLRDSVPWPDRNEGIRSSESSSSNTGASGRCRKRLSLVPTGCHFVSTSVAGIRVLFDNAVRTFSCSVARLWSCAEASCISCISSRC